MFPSGLFADIFLSTVSHVSYTADITREIEQLQKKKQKNTKYDKNQLTKKWHFLTGENRKIPLVCD